MFDVIFDLFRREKLLYRWRERPSLSAFVTNAERKQKPLQFWGKILTNLGIGWAFAAIFAGVSLVTNFESPQVDPMVRFLKSFILGAFALTVGLGLITFSSFQDRIIELFDDRLRFQGITLNYRNLEYFAFTHMVHLSSGARYPCVVFGDRSQETLIIGIPNSRVALRVTEILSTRMTLRTDLMEMQLRDEKT